MLRRHSDKGSEMTLLPLSVYGEAAERLVGSCLNLSQHV